MDRRSFLAAGAAGAVSLRGGERARGDTAEGAARRPVRAGEGAAQGSPRERFPRLRREAFLDAAGGTPLGDFAEEGLRAYTEAWRLGRHEGRWDPVAEMLAEIRPRFARLIGAEADEIGLVHCTKAGEQLVLEGVPRVWTGGNVVTNDLHFTGSLHNLVGLRRSGVDVRIVRSVDWRVPFERMADAIDHDTALVTVSLVSNVNGWIEPIRELTELAHRRGALVFADIIQAAGAIPVDVRAMGIDFAACSGYKWLFGPHGVGFVYAKAEHQGGALRDRLFPGRARHRYAPWVDPGVPSSDGAAWAGVEDFDYVAPTAATRYQPGHVSYMGYGALNEGLKFLEEIGVERVRDHAVRLNRRLLDQIDTDRFRAITPDLDASPILTLAGIDSERFAPRMAEAGVAVSLAPGRMRVSPGIYNEDVDVDRLAELIATL